MDLPAKTPMQNMVDDIMDNTSNAHNATSDEDIVECLNNVSVTEVDNVVHLHINTLVKNKVLMKKINILQQRMSNTIFVVTIEEKIILENIYQFRQFIESITKYNVQTIIYCVRNCYSFIGSMLIVYFKLRDLEYQNYLHIHIDAENKLTVESDIESISENKSVVSLESDEKKNIFDKTIIFNNHRRVFEKTFPTLKYKVIEIGSLDYVHFNHICLKREYLDKIIEVLVKEPSSTNLNNFMDYYFNSKIDDSVFDTINYIIDFIDKYYDLNIDIFAVENLIDYRYLINVKVLGNGIVFDSMKNNLNVNGDVNVLTADVLEQFNELNENENENDNFTNHVFDGETFDMMVADLDVSLHLSNENSSDRKSISVDESLSVSNSENNSREINSDSKSTRSGSTKQLSSELNAASEKKYKDMSKQELKKILTPYLKTNVLFISENSIASSNKYIFKEVCAICNFLDQYNYKGIVVIMSNLNIDSMDLIKMNYDDLVVYYCPIMLTTTDSLNDKNLFAGQNQIILGRNYKATEITDEFMFLFFKMNYEVTPQIRSFEEAVTAKLFIHTFYTLNFNFMKDMSNFCEKMKLDKNFVRNTLIKQNRINVFKENPMDKKNLELLSEIGLMDDSGILSNGFKKKRATANIITRKLPNHFKY